MPIPVLMMMIMMLVALVFPGVRGLSPSIERRAVLAGTATAGLVAALPSLAADAPPAPEVAVVTCVFLIFVVSVLDDDAHRAGRAWEVSWKNSPTSTAAFA